jgi:tetratricopeptide (TPR) repeat protein
MSFWDRLTGGKPKPTTEHLDYLNEALALERQGDFDAALTSYRLALRQTPNNHKVLQNMAMKGTGPSTGSQPGQRLKTSEYPGIAE